MRTETYFQVGERLGDSYEICGVLARRGPCHRYEADDLVLRRRVEIKASDAELGAAALRREALALAAVRHPGLPTVFSLGMHRNQSYMVLEALQGQTVAGLIEERRSAPTWFHVTEIVPILTALAEALHAVHAASRGHGKLGVDTVQVCSGDRVVLLDFATAEVDPTAAIAADRQAFGELGFHLLIGGPPEPGEDDVAATRPDVPVPLAEIIQACLAPGARERPAMDLVAAELRALPRRRPPRRATSAPRIAAAR